MNIKTILQPTDFSAPSLHAFKFACSLARDHQARVVALHVIDVPLRAVEPGLPLPDLQDYKAEAENWFQSLPTTTEDVAIERVTAVGDPVAQILHFADAEHADLIVLGTHGRTGVFRLLMGSVAENVLRRALCPVLAVKAPLRAFEDEDQSEIAQSQPARNSDAAACP